MIEKFQWINYDDETTKNYQMAISYYQQKTDIVMQSLLTGINLKLINTGGPQIPSTEDLIEKMSNNLEPFIENWQQFYDKKPDMATFKSFAQEYNAVMAKANKEIVDIADRKSVIQMLIDNKVITEDLGATLPPTLDLQVIQNDIDKLATGAEGSVGNRTNLMSEIFEQGGRYFTGVIGDAIGEFVQGTGRIINQSGKQIKPDAILTVNPTLTTDLQSARTTSDLSMQIDLEEKVIDLTKITSMDQLSQELGLTNEALGITMKMWTDKARHKTMGYFLTGGDIDRTSAHSLPSTKRLYNMYVHSKYLINIIGALNCLIVSGAGGLERTDAYLQYLLLNHKGIGAANDDLAKKSGLEIKPRYTSAYKRYKKGLNQT